MNIDNVSLRRHIESNGHRMFTSKKNHEHNSGIRSQFFLGLITVYDVFRVQYIAQFAALTADDFTFNAPGQHVDQLFSQPIVSTGFVQVQPDRTKIIVKSVISWVLFNKVSLEVEAKSKLHDAIILQAQKKFLLPLVRAKAKESLKNFLELVVHPLNPTLHLRVRFAGERERP